MKAFLDRFPTDGLRGTVVVLAATAAVPQHYLALDTSGRALVASLGGTTAPTVVYATGADFIEAQPTEALLEVVEPRRGGGAGPRPGAHVTVERRSGATSSTTLPTARPSAT